MKRIERYIGGYMGKWLIIATLVGIGGGVSAFILKNSIRAVGHYGKLLPIWLAPIIGGLIISIIYLWDPIVAGFGTNHYITAVNTNPKHLSPKNFITKLGATAITLGFNGSGGVAGPMMVMGASFAGVIARIPILKKMISKHECNTLLICGAAGAIGAIFRSPLGGGILVVELLYHSTLHYSDLFPAMLSSIMGFAIYGMLENPTPFFDIPYYLPNVYNIPLFVLAATVAAIFSLVFMDVFARVQAFFGKIPYKQLHPAVGGVITGLILIGLPQTGGTGTPVIQMMINEHLPIALLLMLLMGKIFATSFTIASGGSAGLVLPALFVGAIGGNIVSGLLSVTEAGLAASLVIAGMAASLASVANVPIAAGIMLVEMVGLRLGVPAALGSIVGYAIGHRREIYGITCPGNWQYEENQEIKNRDRKM